MAALTIPSLGVQRYGPINGIARFVADSLVIDSLQRRDADENGLSVKGGMRFAQLAKPTHGPAYQRHAISWRSTFPPT